MDTLAKLFGSQARVKLMRLFLSNPEGSFDSKEIARRSRVSRDSLRKEIKLLAGAGLIKAKRIKGVVFWHLNSDFAYRESLKLLLSSDTFLKKSQIAKDFKPAGKIKLLLVSGLFIQDPESRIDFLVVGDNLNRRLIEDRIRAIEAEIGQELRYAVFTTEEFKYRLNMYDKLIREILNYPHERLIDTGELSTALS